MGRVHVRAAGYGAGMNDMNPAPVISAADVTWLRTRRRTAVTDADRAAVRTSLRRLALDLERRPTPTSPLVPILLGVGAIALGFILGWGLCLLADSMWVWLNS